MDAKSFQVIVDITFMLISALLLIKAIKKLSDGINSFIYLLVWVLYVLPIYVDYFYMPCGYTLAAKWRGFEIAQNDVWTNIIYDIIILFIQYYILYNIKGR
jgi:hypothetical protein